MFSCWQRRRSAISHARNSLLRPLRGLHFGSATIVGDGVAIIVLADVASGGVAVVSAPSGPTATMRDAIGAWDQPGVIHSSSEALGVAHRPWLWKQTLQWRKRPTQIPTEIQACTQAGPTHGVHTLESLELT